MRENVKELLGIVARQFPVALQVHIEDHMHEGQRPGPRNLTDKLYVNTGRLRRALYAQGPGNIFRTSISERGLELEYGVNLREVPYARIHEFGGVIRTRRARIQMPARPYLRPSVEEFLRDSLPQLVKRAIGG